VQKNIARAERDNDLIYHQDVPAVSALPVIPEAPVAQLTVPPGLKDPQSAIGNDGVIFGDMPGWGASEAISEFITVMQ
jgi:programmed cell death 6-interacting protein